MPVAERNRGLTPEDREWIRREMAASEERVYSRIKDGAGDLRRDMEDGFGSLRQELGEMIGQVGARVDQVDAEMKAFRQDFNDFRERTEP